MAVQKQIVRLFIYEFAGPTRIVNEQMHDSHFEPVRLLWRALPLNAGKSYKLPVAIADYKLPIRVA